MAEAELKLPGRAAIEVYETEAGLIAIKQDDQWGEPRFVLLTPYDVPVVVRWLQETASDMLAQTPLYSGPEQHD